MLTRLKAALVLFMVSVMPLAATATPAADQTPPVGQLALPNLDYIASRSTDSVAISLDSSLLGIAAGFLDGNKPEDRSVKDILKGIRGIYVRSYKFNHTMTIPNSALQSLLEQLHSSCWQSIISVRKSEEHSNVDIFVCQVEKTTAGLAIIAAEPRELTIVNIVGWIDMNQLRQLQGHFGIPVLPDMSEAPDSGKTRDPDKSPGAGTAK